jgi:hypothetical protein
MILRSSSLAVAICATLAFLPQPSIPLTANSVVETISVTTSPATSGPVVLSLIGEDAGKFRLSSTSVPANLLVGPVDLPDGVVYHVIVAANSLSPDGAAITPDAPLPPTNGRAIILLNAARPAAQYWAATRLEVHGGDLYFADGATWRAWAHGTFERRPAP